MNFLKYPSLVNHYAIGKSQRLVNRYDNMLWYASEKIHGANASYALSANGEEYFAKRSGIIADDDKQFSTLPDCITPDIRQGAKKLFDYYPDADTIYVFGEFFGKGVQHMNYDIVKEGKKAFRVFDVILKFKNGELVVCGINVWKNVFDNDSIVPYNTLGKTLKEFLETSPSEESALGGYSEGIVLKPLAGYPMKTTQDFLGVKYKTEKYLEVKDKPSKPRKKAPELTVEQLNTLNNLGKYITKQRVSNVCSHGDYELIEKNIGKIMMEVKKDAANEFIKETGSTFTEKELIGLTKSFSGEIAKYIKELIQESYQDVLTSN